jgi:hypothetical protein
MKKNSDNVLDFMGLLKKVRFTPKPPKGGFINIRKSISPPWGI